MNSASSSESLRSSKRSVSMTVKRVPYDGWHSPLNLSVSNQNDGYQCSSASSIETAAWISSIALLFS